MILITIPDQTHIRTLLGSHIIFLAKQYYFYLPQTQWYSICINNNKTATFDLRRTNEMKMEANKILIICLLFVIVSFAYGDSSSGEVLVKKVKGKKVCDKGWECKGWSEYCCNLTISDYFDTYQFEELFAKRNTPVAHASGFWDYKSFITASALYQPHGFGTTGNKTTQMKEIAAFLGHVGSQTSCGYGVATGGPTAWGLCYNKEMSPPHDYCDEYYKYTYPCAPGAGYYGRGALPIYWQYNYGKIGEALKVDLLNHPEYIEQNATLAFQAAIHQWVTPQKKGQPSAHEAFVGTWKPTKNDTLSKRLPGFGTTMNILYGDRVCGKGDVDDMNTITSHYLHYLDLMGVGREEGGPHEVLTCADQLPFNPSAPTQASSRCPAGLGLLQDKLARIAYFQTTGTTLHLLLYFHIM